MDEGSGNASFLSTTPMSLTRIDAPPSRLAPLSSQAMRMATAKGAFAPRVLTVDNYLPALESLSEELRWGGYVVKNVHSAHEAVLVAQSFLPDLMVADVALPSMDGLAAAVEIKQWDPQCEVLLFADTDIVAGKKRSLAACGFHFQLAAKPAPPTELLRQVDQMLGTHWQSRLAS